MAVSLVNPKLSVSDSQMAYLEEARSRSGYHVYYQGDGESTTNRYVLPLSSVVSAYSPTIVFAVNIAVGFKEFEFRLFAGRKPQHILYQYPNPDVKDSKEPIAWRKFNEKDHPLDAPVSNNLVRAGMRILRITYDENLEIQFYVDSEPLMGKRLVFIDQLNHVSITTDNGYVFEGHYTAEDPLGPFDVVGFEASATPKLAPGACIEITGIAEEGRDVQLVVSQRGYANQEPQSRYVVKIPTNKVITWLVRYYARKLTIDSGEKVTVYEHNFLAPAWFSVRKFTVYNLLMWSRHVSCDHGATDGCTINMKNPKTIQGEPKKASPHFRQITEVRQFGRGGILCCSPDHTCVKELLNCSTFASHPWVCAID
ncbi:uncharacterized protein [Dermacentor albipictus]|uniref:uncharacterized protein isoform X2 n=1 Tax=Dermacentor albipictus TaxID=60249 RepID=UPI0038FC339F